MNLSGTKKAPPANVVLPHYAFGAFAFFVLTVLMLFFSEAFTGHYFNPKLLAITHVAALGWICMIIFGALYQLLPVILLAELFSNAIARITFYLFGAGIILLCVSFANFWVGLPLQLASLLLLIAAILFAINVFFTAKKSNEINTEAEFILTSALWLLVVVIIGVLMTFNFTYPFLPADHLIYMKLHSHIGFAGWFMLLIMGVGSKLIPMFLLSSEVNTKKLKISYYFVNAALLGFFIDALFLKSTDRAIIYFLTAITGTLFFVSYLYDAYRKRARRNLDAGMKHTVFAFLFVSIPVLSGIIVQSGIMDTHASSMQISIVYAVSVLLGFISFLIMGQTFKTLPFIVWLHRYKSLNGKTKTPLPRDLFSEKLLQWQFVSFVIAYPILQTGILMKQTIIIKIACSLLLITSVLYNINVFKILFHSNKIKA